jgi:hypothetical protein
MLYFCALLTDLEAKNLWTAAWLTVHVNITVNAPPIVNVQNVLRIVGSGLKLEAINKYIYEEAC